MRVRKYRFISFLCFALICSLVFVGCSKSKTLTERPNIILIVLDTVAANRMSLYSANRPTTPELDQLAHQGRYYTNFYANSCWTIPSHASLFTGLYPIRHRATQENLHLDEKFDTLAEILKKSGYQTIGISDNPAVSEELGFSQGFENFIEMWRPKIREQYGSGVHPNNTAALEFCKNQKQEKPFFIFMNYIEAHTPYEPPEKFLKPFLEPGDNPEDMMKRSLKRSPRHYLKKKPITSKEFKDFGKLYDGELAYLSSVINQLYQDLDQEGWTKHTLIVITSDHGENLGIHDHFTHVFTLYNSTQWVPLIILDPKESRPGSVVDEMWQLHDLFPAILEYAGVESSKLDHQARNMFDASFKQGREAVFGEYYFPLQALDVIRKYGKPEDSIYLEPYMRRLRSVQTSNRKLIWGSDGNSELYDIASDPGEISNLIGDPQHKEELENLENLLDQYVRNFKGDIPLPPETSRLEVLKGFEGIVDQESAERLKRMGYVE